MCVCLPSNGNFVYFGSHFFFVFQQHVMHITYTNGMNLQLTLMYDLNVYYAM